MRVEFRYNADGLRTQKKILIGGAVSEVNDYTLHGKLITHLTKRSVESDGSEGVQELHFFYDAQSRPAVVEYNGEKYRYIHNLQGDVVGIVDHQGDIAAEYKYDAWGKAIDSASTGNIGQLNLFRYRGYVWDEETKLYYLRSRYYNPSFKRFISADKCFGIITRIQTHNLFCYCLNDPISGEDSSGHAFRNAVFSYGKNILNKVWTMLESFIESVKKTSIKGRRLISEGKIMKIYEPTKSVGYTIGPVPKTVASGKINQSYFAWGNLGINFGTLDISSTGFLNIFKDSIITIDISITVTQTGDLAPEAHIIAKFYRNYTDIELGVISSNKVAESGAIYITGANQRGYYFMTMGGKEHYISDKDGWLEKLVERIEMEWYT